MSGQEFSDPDSIRTVSFFTGLLRDHGESHKALNWGSQSSQELRFRILSEIGINKGASILDVGCGLGDFFAWQNTQGLELGYTGIDITPAMIASAKERFPSALFLENKLDEMINQSFDYVIASGIFYMRMQRPREYFERTVAKLFDKCKQGISFNSLSMWCKSQNKHEFYADPLRSIDFCRSLSPHVVLRHDYHPCDFTIYIRRLGANE